MKLFRAKWKPYSPYLNGLVYDNGRIVSHVIKDNAKYGMSAVFGVLKDDYGITRLIWSIHPFYFVQGENETQR